MKVRSLVLGLMLMAGLITSCNDDLNYVGGTIQPDSDKINVKVDSFMMTASTVKVDSIYAKTTNGYLGQFFDPQFGEYKADYISQFYCEEGFKFGREPIDGKIDSIRLYISLSSYVGDSLSPMKAEVFPVIKALDRNYYTNINPEEYCDLQNSFGGRAYTVDAVKTTPSDSGRIIVPLAKELGQRFYDETINNPSSFANQDAFNRFFPGLYVTNTYGMGTVVKILRSYFRIYYSFEDTTKDINGNDSLFIANGLETFMVTNEVIQMNRMNSYGLDELLQPNDNYTYIKTPAGVYTRLVIPAKDILTNIGERIINNFPLVIKALPQSDWQYASAPPSNMLLLPEDSLKSFFENNKIYDNVTSFIATSSAYTYNFGNIARLLKTHKEKNPDQDLRLLVVPVDVPTQTVSYNTVVTGVNNYQAPSGVTIRKDSEVMSIGVTTSKYNE